MANTHSGIRAAVVIFLVLLMASPSLSAKPAPPKPVEKIFFKRIGVLDPEDRTHQSYSKVIGKRLRRELAGTFRFEIVPQPKLSKKLPLSTPNLIELAKQFKLDGIISGRVEIVGDALKLELILLNGKTAMPFAREYVVIKDFKSPGIIDRYVRTITSKLIGRIPYQATVAAVRNKGRTIVIDAGQLNGLATGTKVRVFSIGKVKKNLFTGELIGIDEIAVGELAVVRADERVSLAKPSRMKKGKTVALGQYVRFVPSANVLSRVAPRREEILARLEREWGQMEAGAQKEAVHREAVEKEAGKIAKEALLPSVSRGRLELDGGVAWSNYTLDADSYEFNQKMTSYPVIRAAAEFWVIQSVGIDADYQIGFFKLESPGGGSVNVKGRPYWITSHLKFRHIFLPGRADLQLIGRVGYAWYTSRLSETNSQFLIDTRYRGPSMGLEVRCPLTSNMAATVGADYRPVVSVREDPATSGETASAWSIQVHAEALYRMHHNLWMSVRYLYEDYKVTYSGMGTRAGGISGAETTDKIKGVTVGLVQKF